MGKERHVFCKVGCTYFMNGKYGVSGGFPRDLPPRDHENSKFRDITSGSRESLSFYAHEVVRTIYLYHLLR